MKWTKTKRNEATDRRSKNRNRDREKKCIFRVNKNVIYDNRVYYMVARLYRRYQTNSSAGPFQTELMAINHNQFRKAERNIVDIHEIYYHKFIIVILYPTTDAWFSDCMYGSLLFFNSGKTEKEQKI